MFYNKMQPFNVSNLVFHRILDYNGPDFYPGFFFVSHLKLLRNFFFATNYTNMHELKYKIKFV